MATAKTFEFRNRSQFGGSRFAARAAQAIRLHCAIRAPCHAYDARLLGATGRVFVDSVVGFYRRTLRDLVGAGSGQSGAVTVVQRCSSDLRLNPHFHAIVFDGVFVPAAGGELEFHALPALSNTDIADLLLQRLALEASETSRQWQHYYSDLLGFYFADAMPEYRADPPEMLVFGATGVDWIQIGYVVHAPERDVDDYPVVRSYPIGYELGVVGRNTVEAVKNLALTGREPSAELSATETEQLEALGKALGVDFRRARPTTKRWPLRPKAHPRYTFRGTSDGVGVFAPIDAFARQREPTRSVRSLCAAALDVAEKALRAGVPGTALVLSKDALYDDPDSPQADELRRLAARAYRQLGRRLHARRILGE